MRMSSKKAQELIIKYLNEQFGSDLRNLHKAEYVIKDYEERFNQILQKVDLTNNSSEIKNSVSAGDDQIATIDFEIEKLTQFQEVVGTIIKNNTTIIDDVKPQLENIQDLNHLIQYLTNIQEIQDITAALNNAMKGKDDTKIVQLYLSLYDETNINQSICGKLIEVEASFLKSYATKTTIYWHEIIQERFSKDFEAMLKVIKWPPLNIQVVDSYMPPVENLHKLKVLAEYLYLIKSPDDDPHSLISITPSILCPQISKTTELILKPFKQRFLYHFTGVRQTNRLDKPEWYYTQILNFAKQTHLFVGKTFQPVAVRTGRESFNIRLEFIRGLVQLTIEKLVLDIEHISQETSLFAHLVDETLAFEIELHESLGYPNSFPSAILVITQPQYLLKWLQIEEKFCADRMDVILHGDSPWSSITTNNSEDLKIPVCADQFIRLLDSIKERYYVLTQPGHQLQFLNLQLELIDNFRLRLAQLHASDYVDTISILNTINYITSVLKEWGENVHYLHLHAALVGTEANEVNSVFDQSIDELEHWQTKLLELVASKIFDEIKAKSMSYRHSQWSSLPEQNANEPFMLTSTAGEMFQIMMMNLHNLEKNLSISLFNTIIRLISQHLDQFILDCMVMITKFSTGGAAQFQNDMKRNLFALFGQYNRRPELLFKRINDSCILLNSPKGNILLLYQTLKEDLTLSFKINALKEIGIMNLKPEMCIDILERRKDIKIL